MATLDSEVNKPVPCTFFRREVPFLTFKAGLRIGESGCDYSLSKSFATRIEICLILFS